MKETLKHIQAFEYYYSLGESRTYQKVAKHFGVSPTSIQKWGGAFEWPKRVIERDQALGEELRRATDEEIFKEISQYRKVINAAVGKFVEDLKAGKAKVTANDLIRLIPLQLDLMGIDLEALKRFNSEEEGREEVKTVVNFFNSRGEGDED